MGQQEVFETLKEKKVFLSANDIAKICSDSYAVVIRCLNKMLKFNEVEKKIYFEERKAFSGITYRKIYLWKLRQ